ncbi:MAG: hypothetical protein JXA97_00090 [Anaerolineales bacterium]|nr:hypothetical protein [Anaerolineales bacterium]
MGSIFRKIKLRFGVKDESNGSGFFLSAPDAEAWQLLTMNLLSLGGEPIATRGSRSYRRETDQAIARELQFRRDEAHTKAAKLVWRGKRRAAQRGFALAAACAAHANWFVSSQDAYALNAAKALASYDRYRSLSGTCIQKWIKPPGTQPCGYLHVPDGDGPYPAVILFPDELSVKEMLTPIVELALDFDIAVLTVDPPGWNLGASPQRRQPSDWSNFISAACGFLQDEGRIDCGRLAAGAMLTGAFWALYCGAIESRIGVSVAIIPQSPLDVLFADGVEKQCSLAQRFILEHAGCSHPVDYLHCWESLEVEHVLDRCQDAVLVDERFMGDAGPHMQMGCANKTLLEKEPALSLLAEIPGSLTYQQLWRPALEWLEDHFRNCRSHACGNRGMPSRQAVPLWL